MQLAQGSTARHEEGSNGASPGMSPNHGFEVGAMDIPGARVVWCRGELDISSEEEVVAEIARALGRPINSIVLDLRALTFADCTVIRCIEYAIAASQRCQVNLYVDSGETVRKLAQILGPDLPEEIRGYL